MKVDSICIEGFRGATKKTYTFENIAYLYGRNGAGKSTVIKALQWALLGYIPGTNKTNSSIFSHANGPKMAVTIRLSNGYTICRSLTRQGNSISSNLSTEPEDLDVNSLIGNLSLPVFNFNDFVNMSSNQLKDWFLSFLPKEDMVIDWDSIFQELADSANLQDMSLLDDLIKSGKQFQSDTQNFNKYIKQLLSVKKAERAQIDGAIRSLIFYDDVDMNTDISELRNTLANLQSKLIDANNALKAKSDNARIADKLSTLPNLASSFDEDSEVKELNAELEHIHEVIENLKANSEKLHSDLNDAKNIAANLKQLAESDSICPYTNSRCSSIKNLIESSKSDYQSAIKSVSETKNRLDENENTYRDYVEKYNSIKQRISIKEDAYARRSVYLQCICNVNEADLNLDPIAIQNQIKSTNDEISKHLANDKFQSAVDKLTADGFILDLSIAFLKSAEKVTGPNGIITDSMDDPFDKFSKSINKFVQLLIGSRVSAKFTNSRTANSFGFGIERDGMYLPYNTLSSGEQCLFAFSLMLAIVNESADPLKVLLIDDVVDHLDDLNAIRFFESVSAIRDIQIIMAGVKMCSESYAVEVK